MESIWESSEKEPYREEKDIEGKGNRKLRKYTLFFLEKSNLTHRVHEYNSCNFEEIQNGQINVMGKNI